MTTSELSESKTSGPALGRRGLGIAALFACALMVDPARIVPEVTALGDIDSRTALHALVIPALAALGLWLVTQSAAVTAICVVMLAGAHAAPGTSDLFTGYLYPAITVIAALYLAKAMLFTRAPDTKQSEAAQ